jgi:hypothetical protein
VLVQKTVVFFVKADSVGDNKRSTAVVIEGSIEVVDSTETITTKSQRVGAQTETIFTDIESVLAEMRSVGISVRYNHLRERHTVEQGTLLITILVADVMENKTFTVVEGNAKVPLLPVNLISIHLERNTFGLLHNDRLDVLTVFIADELGIEIVWLHRNGRALKFRVTGGNTFNLDDFVCHNVCKKGRE